MAQKRPNLVQNLHFWSFWAKYCHFLHVLSNAQTKNNVNKVPMWVFRYVGNKTFDFSSKKRIFRPKTTKFGPKLAFLVNLGQAMQAYSMPCCGSVVGCGARAVSRKTPIYFIGNQHNLFHLYFLLSIAFPSGGHWERGIRGNADGVSRDRKWGNPLSSLLFDRQPFT